MDYDKDVEMFFIMLGVYAVFIFLLTMWGWYAWKKTDWILLVPL